LPEVENNLAGGGIPPDTEHTTIRDGKTMNKKTIRLAVPLLLIGLTATGCGNDMERLDGLATPAGAPSPSRPASAAPIGSPTAPSATPATPATSASTSRGTPATPATSKTTTKSTSSNNLVLGPRGLGGLTLGMTRRQAEATSLIEGYEVEDFTGNCGISHLRTTGDTVYFTPGLGLSNITAPDGVRTPEGIRVGSTIKELQRAYPDWEEVLGGGDSGYGWVEVPGHSKNSYRIDVRDGKVSSVVLSTEGQKCVE
jgi:hypothetical protein